MAVLENGAVVKETQSGCLDEWPLRVGVDTPLAAAASMARDEEFGRKGKMVGRLFIWESPALSLGLKQLCPTWLKIPDLRSRGIEVVTRPTGGGIAFHGSDVCCGVVIPQDVLPSGHEAASMVCKAALSMCRSFGVEVEAEVAVRSSQRVSVCLTEPSPYAIVSGKRKLAGFAIRRYQASWLIQGSVLVGKLPDRINEVLPNDVLHEVRNKGVSLCEAAGRRVSEREVIERWAGCLRLSLAEADGRIENGLRWISAYAV